MKVYVGLIGLDCGITKFICMLERGCDPLTIHLATKEGMVATMTTIPLKKTLFLTK